MSYVAIGVTVGGAIAKGVSKGVAKRKARKAAKKEKERLAIETEKQKKALGSKYAAEAQAEKDLGNVYAGAASIDPEAQYARNASERGTSSAINNAMRSGASTGEIMNMVSGLTAKGQLQGQEISAAAQERRVQMQGMAQAQAIKAAQSGLAGEEAMIGLEDKKEQRGMEAQQQIYQAAGEDAAFTAGIIDDIGAGAMMGAGGIGNTLKTKAAASKAAEIANIQAPSTSALQWNPTKEYLKSKVKPVKK